MTRPNAAVIVIVIALVLAGLASWGAYSYLSKEAQKSKAAAGQPVVVAAADLPIGTKLDATQLKQVNWPTTNIPPGGFQQAQPLEGRIVIRQLSAGDAITEQKLMPKEGASMAGVMSYIIPQGHRAVTVGVNEVAGVAGFVAPNNRVDIILTTPIPRGTAGENISKIILQNVTVLATGQITEQKEGKPVVVPTVTLDLVPEDAEKLVLAASKGSLQLLLRSVIDTAPAVAQGATITKVLGGSESYVAPTVHPVVAKQTKRPARKRTVAAAPQVQAAPVAQAPRPSYAVTFIDGSVRTTKEFVLQ